MKILLRLVPVLMLALCASAIPYENPVRTSDQDEVESLPNLDEAITFRHFSGYLKADEANKKFLHYWFVEATEKPESKPVLLWLNGGPGCSSMEGLFSELGPFQLNNAATKITLRQYSWNKLANVIFLESPVGVGYSYTTKLLNTETDDTVAKENYLALKSFYEKFPQYKSNPLFLSGESYAGVYLPTLGVLVDADKDINLRGIAIGNGYLDAKKLDESLIYFSYYHGLLGKSDWDSISENCCDGKPPARGNCVFEGPKVHLRCKFSISEKMEQLISTSGLNPYNLYGDCPKSNLSQAEMGHSKLSVDRALKRLVMDRRVSGDYSKPFELLDLQSSVNQEPPCFDGDAMIRYLNDAKVREAIHIPKRLGNWGVCANLLYSVKYPIRDGGLAPQVKQLVNSKRKLALLIFNGDTDLMCNALGDEWFTDDLGLKMISDYKAWKVGKQIGGWVKHYDGIAFATVRGAGHMVPEYRPKEAFAMISVVLNSTDHKINL